MHQFPIGVLLTSFREEGKAAVRNAKACGAVGIQVPVVRGELAVDTLVGDQRQEFRKFVEAEGLTITALLGDSGDFMNREKNPAQIEQAKRILDMAKELGTDIVTSHIGLVPEDKTLTRYQIMQEACAEIGAYAESIGAYYAIETGPERAVTLKGFLDEIGSHGMAVNLDPANLVMIPADDPVAAVYTLRDYIVHTHAKDGYQIYAKDPERIYGEHPDEIYWDSFEVTPLGEGKVDFPNFLKALDDIGYRGFLTIERVIREDPMHDVSEAVHFLKALQ